RRSWRSSPAPRTAPTSAARSSARSTRPSTRCPRASRRRPGLDRRVARCCATLPVSVAAGAAPTMGVVPAADPRDRPIAIFDSGVGGLTVLHELLVSLPQEDFVYLGDSAR